MFLIKKPMLISNEEKSMSPSLVPNIFVCPHPSYDVNLLSSNGYLTPFWWYSGFDKQFKFIGWNGDQGSFTNNISESVATLKKSSLIPSIQLQIMMKDKINNRYTKLLLQVMFFHMEVALELSNQN